MARLRYNGLATGAAGSTVPLALGGSGLTSSATSVTFNAALTHSNGVAVPTLATPDYIPLVILDSNGHESEIVYMTGYTAGGTGGLISRGKEGTTGVAHSAGDRVICSPTVTDITAETGVIAVKSYSPATQQTYSPTTTAYVDMDATNLAVTFTAPSSGKVVIQTSIGYSLVGGSLMSIDLREGTSDLAGTQRVAGNIQSTVSPLQGTVSPLWVIAGLTAGSTHTYKLGMSRLSGTAAVQFIIEPTSVWGDVHIVVTAAP